MQINRTFAFIIYFLAAFLFFALGQQSELIRFVEVGRKAAVLGQTSSVLDAKIYHQRVAISLDFLDWKMGYKWRFMFDIYLGVFFFKKARRFLKNSGQLARRQTMIGVILEPCLQAAHGVGAARSAAINILLI